MSLVKTFSTGWAIIVAFLLSSFLANLLQLAISLKTRLEISVSSLAFFVEF
jgi:hypothetical protein